MRIPSLGLVFPRGLTLGASLCISEHWCTSLLQSNIQTVFSTVIHSIQVFDFYRSGLRNWGTVNGTQTGISIIHSNLLRQNLRKIDISSSLSCNPSTEQLDSAISPT